VIFGAIVVIASLLAATAGSVDAQGNRGRLPGYEIWGADQSNSVAGAEARGVDGSFIWVWDSEDMRRQISHGVPAQPLGCDGANNPGDGPCDIKDVFPGGLVEHDGDGATGGELGDYLYGRLHGMLPDPQNRYMNVNLFGPGNGFIGIIDGATKEAVALFRVTGTTAGQRVHMSDWNSDGSALLIANLNGKVLERIDVTRDDDGAITDVAFNRSASLGVGKNLAVTDEVKVYLGANQHGNQMMGRITGSYDDADLGDLTPAGKCRENGCESGPDGEAGGRVNNVIICPITSTNDNVYITFGGGGLLIADLTSTPMSIVGEYGQQVINGAGCGGSQVRNEMWVNAGVSASGAGLEQSTFTIYTIDDRAFTTAQPENSPAPQVVYADDDATDGNGANTATIGNVDGDPEPNLTGQLPGVTTRRDSHGMTPTVNGRYVHTVDRIQNVVEVISTRTKRRTTYDLTSRSGLGRFDGPCAAASVTDDPGLPGNDPAPDLMEATPDGRYLVVALRGPTPVSVTHAAQGSCPGVGVIRLTNRGQRGKLVAVLRTTNTIDDAPVSAPGGHAYVGAERSDVHGAAVRLRVEDRRR
jgi:hypothetical protein